ncbi:hypothetical protein MJ561_24345 [Klebsiella pneumoniae]|nr:hypothetical protein MJ561_24345 [Klebsiella pneumoniae]
MSVITTPTVRASRAGNGADRRAGAREAATDADVPAQYRGIGIRIEDDIVITGRR